MAHLGEGVPLAAQLALHEGVQHRLLRLRLAKRATSQLAQARQHLAAVLLQR